MQKAELMKIYLIAGSVQSVVEMVKTLNTRYVVVIIIKFICKLIV